jgi:hypothetical protein
MMALPAMFSSKTSIHTALHALEHNRKGQNFLAIRLHIPGQGLTSGPYMTICWGDPSKMTKLTSHKYDALKKGIPVSELPKVF